MAVSDQKNLGRIPKIIVIFCGMVPNIFWSDSLWAQAQSKNPQFAPKANQTQRATISDTPYAASRENSMPASAPFVENSDASLVNPANIGGLLDRTLPARGTIRQFYFPYAAFQANDAGQAIVQDVGLSTTAPDLTYATAIKQASNGNNQFARASLMPGMGFGRFVLAPIVDRQLAVTQTYEGSSTVELLQQERFGFGGGISFVDPSETLSLGVFSSTNSLQRTEGQYTVADVEDLEQRVDMFNQDTHKYSGTDTNAGLSLRVNKKASAIFSLTALHAGNTKYKSTGGDSSQAIEDKENVTASFGIAPRLGNILSFSLGASATDISNKDLPVSDKWRSGAELSLGGINNHSFIGIHGGASSLGGHYGCHINLGFIGVQYANYPVDIGVLGQREIERRNAGVVTVDLSK